MTDMWTEVVERGGRLFCMFQWNHLEISRCILGPSDNAYIGLFIILFVQDPM